MILTKEMIDKTIPIPLYFQLKELILSEIKAGAYPGGSVIPTENDLIDMFGISRTTVRQAIAELVNAGWLYRVKSKGTFVSFPKINQDFVTRIESSDCAMARQNTVSSTEVLELSLMKADKIIAAQLNLEEKEQVVYLHRKRYENQEPIVTIKTYLPHKYCMGLLEKDFTKASLYEELSKEMQTKVTSVCQQIGAAAADARDAKELNIARGKPIQCVKSIGYNIFKQPREYSLARYRGDRSSFKVVIG